MKSNHPYLLKNAIQHMCVENHYFYHGDNLQYERMFDMAVDEEFSIRDVALVIWICSSEEKGYKDIFRNLTAVYRKIEEEREDAET